MSDSSNTTKHRGERVLALGVASIVCAVFGPCCVAGIVAAFPLGIAARVMGHGDLIAMHAGTIDSSGRKATRIGEVCGMLGIALALLFPVLFLIMGRFLALELD